MRKLALSDEILMSIEKPARYIGGEYNSVMKDKEQVDVRFCMCFPDVYEIGMSHLGIQILYGGSVKPDNAKAILSLDNVDGLLVGGASLQAQSFADIVRADLA